jgi:hypothetical protein
MPVVTRRNPIGVSVGTIRPIAAAPSPARAIRVPITTYPGVSGSGGRGDVAECRRGRRGVCGSGNTYANANGHARRGEQ